MPWKTTSKEEQRLELVRLMRAGQVPVVELCGRFNISRTTAYKWLWQYRLKPRRILRDGSRRPAHLARAKGTLWRRRVKRARRRHPSWGARKLRQKLLGRHKSKQTPAVATITRWLKRWGLSVRRRRRPRRGPLILQKPLHVPARCHEVWTVDFKGWYRTARGVRVEPLTVRDLFSRFVLRIALLRRVTVVATQREFRRLFLEHGVPQRIRCDNGAPFGGGGPTGLTRLSAWWLKAGIEVEFITPGRPCENGAHEQFHRVYKAEVASGPAVTVKAQQVRSDVWQRHYNRERPHEALQMKSPGQLFKKNRRTMPARLMPWSYPEGWERRWVKGNGEINWKGQRRFVGQAFVRDYVGLKPVEAGIWQVYFGKWLVGELRENETGSIRTVQYRRAR
jgi:putative transposase